MTTGAALVWLAVVLAAGAVAGGARRAGGWALSGAALALTGAVARLGWAFAGQDWTLRYVADNTRSGVSPVLRVAGLWAGPEGSLLLWTAALAWAAMLAVRAAGPASAAVAWARRLGGGLVGAYALVVALAASPFERLALPAVDGLGLQPVLEHPAMVWHPPILYAGLVGLLAPSLASAARARAGLGPQVPAALVAGPLALLTAGLLTGARWADVELGWGGYWAWDPIESAGLVAWLCGAATLHGLPRRAVIGGRTAMALGVAPGLAALWATTATRVGLVSSVHAFADQEALRIGLLTVAALASAAGAALVAGAGAGAGAGAAGDGAAGGRPAVGRWPAAAWLRGAVAVLAVAALFVAVGAYEPLVEAGTTGDAVAIAGRYYSRLLWPVVMAGAALAVSADRRWWPALAGAALAGATTPWAAGPYGVALALAGGAVAGSALGRLPLRDAPPAAPGATGSWRLTHRVRGASPVAPGAPSARGTTELLPEAPPVVRGATRSRRVAGVGRALGHLGTGMLLVGVAGSMAGRVTRVEAPTGTPVRAGSVELVHEKIDLVDDGAATRSAVATVRVDGTELHPGLVSYRLRGVSTVELAHRYRWFDQLQVLLIDGEATSAEYQVNELPRVGLVWLGGTAATVGLATTALTRRPRTR